MTNWPNQKKNRKLSLTRPGNTVILAGVPKMRFAVEVKYHEEHGVHTSSPRPHPEIHVHKVLNQYVQV